jgi:hypothetical protein
MKPINRTYTPEVGMALATKNGQLTGNAFILAKEGIPAGREDVAVYYTILTDFGNTFKLLPSEIVDRFDVADWWYSELAILEEYGFTSNGVDIRCPKQRIERQIELLNDVLKELDNAK